MTHHPAMDAIALRRWASPTPFRRFVDSLPDDWTDLEIDLRLLDEERYIDAAVLLTQINAQPYSKADWHWRLLVAHRFGHAAAAETVKGTLALLDGEGIEGQMVVRDVREGRAEVVQMWGRPESRACESFAAAEASDRVARVVALVPDLMLASRVEATLAGAGTR